MCQHVCQVVVCVLRGVQNEGEKKFAYDGYISKRKENYIQCGVCNEVKFVTVDVCSKWTYGSSCYVKQKRKYLRNMCNYLIREQGFFAVFNVDVCDECGTGTSLDNISFYVELCHVLWCWLLLLRFFVFCTVHCNVIVQYKPTKCIFSKLIF